MKRALFTFSVAAGAFLISAPGHVARSQQAERQQPSAATLKAHDAGSYGEAAAMIEADLSRCRATSRFADDCLDLLQGAASFAISAGQLEKAEAHARDALALALATFGERNVATAEAHSNLGSALFALGKLREAEPHTRKDLEITLALLGENHPDAAISYNNLAIRLDALARFEEAERHHRKAMAIWRAAPDMERYVAVAHDNLAKNLDNQGRYGEGEVEYRAALEIDRRILPADHPVTARVRANLGTNLEARGRFAEAESEYREALATRERRLDPAHPDVAHSVARLAANLGLQGREAEAETLGRRALAIRRASLGPRHPEVGYTLSDLAVGIERQRRIGEATPLFREAHAIVAQSLGDSHPQTLTIAVGLAKNLTRLGNRREPEALLRDAVAKGAGLGAKHPDLARFRIELSRFLVGDGRESEAIPMLRIAIPALAAAIGEDHPDVIQARALLGKALRRAGLLAEAHRWAAGAADAAVGRFAMRTGTSVDERRTISDFAAVFELRIGILWSQSHAPGTQAADACGAPCEEAFAAAQWAINSSTAYAIERVAARTARGSGRLAAIEREREDLIFARDADDRRYLSLADGEALQRNALLAARATKAARIEAIDREIAAADPAYVEIARPRPVSIAEVQAALRSDEALLVAVPAEDAGYVWVVTRERVQWMRRTALRAAMLADTVTRLRAGLSAGATESRGQSGRAASIFDRKRAAGLYAELVAPADRLLAGKRTLLTVSTGALASLPLGILPTGTLANARWLVDRFALATLPAPSSLLRIRCAVCPGRRVAATAAIEFAGIGAPDIDATAGASIRSGGWLKGLPALPFAARELETIGASFPGRALVVTGPAATEARVRSDPAILNARLLTFATHTVRAGEPALLLTASAGTAGEDGDGLLTVSEAAQLQLGADLVVLSACDTAAPDGSFQGDDLSGFARAFFSAGARALMVSHWPVNDEATARLMVAMFARLRASEAPGRAAALRTAMRELRDSPGGRWAHPRYWAAFTLVGDPD